jgi:hypothetical protein
MGFSDKQPGYVMSTYCLHATIKVKHGKLQQFVEAYEKQVPVLEGYGWKLVGGWTNIFGRVYTVVNMWEIPAADTFLETSAKWRDTPAGQAFRTVTAEVVEEEVALLMRKLPYSP